MSHARYQRLQRVWITPAAVEELNKAIQEVVILPEVLTMDEKLSPFDGNSPFIRHVPNKDPSNGHWILEATIKGAATGLPILWSSYPVQQNTGPTMVKFYQEALKTVPIATRHDLVVVSDAYYLDDRSRTWLRDSKYKYLAAVNPTRFKEVWEPLIDSVKKPGEFSLSWNPSTKETAMHYWHPELKHLYILTNAFSYQPTGAFIDHPPMYDAYQLLFNTADRLNHFLADKRYPYCCQGWMYDYDDFHFSTLLWNTYALYHEFYSTSTMIKWKTFCVDLAMELWGQVVE